MLIGAAVPLVVALSPGPSLPRTGGTTDAVGSSKPVSAAETTTPSNLSKPADPTVSLTPTPSGVDPTVSLTTITLERTQGKTPAKTPTNSKAPVTPGSSTVQNGNAGSSTVGSTVSPPPHSSKISVAGGKLMLAGRPYTFVGVNAFELGTQWGTNFGCGGMETDTDLDHLFSSLPPNSLVRFWAFQGTLATNYLTHQLDWGPLDRVFAVAASYHQRLIVTLTDQSGTCDGNHWQDLSWYQGGFKQVFNDPSTTDGRGSTPMSYWDFMRAVVQRYKDSPALGMWEPISEAESSDCPAAYSGQGPSCWGHQTCPDEAAAAAGLRYFFDVVGGEVHALDPTHLVENGLLGGGQCGTQGADYQYVSGSPGIDVLSYHDYSAGTDLIPGDQWNGLGVRLSQAKALNKPIIGGELGVAGGTASGCTSLSERADQVAAKVQAQVQAGSSGVLIWNWVPQMYNSCSTDTFPGDPLMQWLSTEVLG